MARWRKGVHIYYFLKSILVINHRHVKTLILFHKNVYSSLIVCPPFVQVKLINTLSIPALVYKINNAKVLLFAIDDMTLSWYQIYYYVLKFEIFYAILGGGSGEGGNICEIYKNNTHPSILMQLVICAYKTDRHPARSY